MLVMGCFESTGVGVWVAGKKVAVYFSAAWVFFSPNDGVIVLVGILVLVPGWRVACRYRRPAVVSVGIAIKAD